MNGYISDLHWQSDWNGDEVGYNDIGIVGLYTSVNLGIDVYLDAETGEILEVMPNEEDIE